MKRIIIGLFAVLLITNIIFMIYKDGRFNPPNEYAHPINTQIDYDYHHPDEVLRYLENATEMSFYAKRMWINEGIDVLYVDQEDPEAIKASNYYKALKKQVLALEAKLIRSMQLKEKGYSNEDIESIEKVGEKEFLSNRKVNHLIELKDELIKRGDKNELVFELQISLNKIGYKMPTDGTFGYETEQGLLKYQKDNNLFPSGKLNKKTLSHIQKKL